MTQYAYVREGKVVGKSGAEQPGTIPIPKHLESVSISTLTYSEETGEFSIEPPPPMQSEQVAIADPTIDPSMRF